MFKQIKKHAAIAATATTALAVSAQSQAAGWDYASLTSGVDFGTIQTGVLAVAAAIAIVYAGIKGARMVLGFLRS